nr:11020_t:CDS:2 [Entrophospora candida]
MTAKKLKASIRGYVEADEHDEYIKSKPSSKKHKEKFETDEQEEHIKSKSSSEKGKEKSELDGQDLELMAEINSQGETETDDQGEPLKRALKSRKLKVEQAKIDKKSLQIKYYKGS